MGLAVHHHALKHKETNLRPPDAGLPTGPLIPSFPLAHHNSFGVGHTGLRLSIPNLRAVTDGPRPLASNSLFFPSRLFVRFYESLSVPKSQRTPDLLTKLINAMLQLAGIIPL